MCLMDDYVTKSLSRTRVRYWTDMVEAVLPCRYTWRLIFGVVCVATGSLCPTEKYTTPRGSSLSAMVMLANRAVSLMAAPAPTW